MQTNEHVCMNYIKAKDIFNHNYPALLCFQEICLLTPVESLRLVSSFLSIVVCRVTARVKRMCGLVEF